MSNVKISNLIPGKIYITKGGLLTLHNGEKVPWGYDRVKFIKETKYGLLVSTPWGSECSLNKNYPLVETTESVIRSEFPLRGLHVSRETILFPKALVDGICTEIDAKDLKIEKTVLSNKAGSVAADDFTQQFIEFFGTSKKLSVAAKHFGVPYQKIKYTLDKIKKIGHNAQRFKIDTVNDRGLAIIITKV